MGINKQALSFILAEHSYRPLAGSLLSIGKQTVTIPPDTIRTMFRAYGLPLDRLEAAYASDGLDRKTRHGRGNIHDHQLFAAFSECRYESLDISDYEGATHIADLNQPVPESLHGRFDVIFDGSVMDNAFDPVSFIRNTSRMLKPGGRIINFECAGAHAGAYLSFSPEWFYSYYAVNDFADCRIFVTIARHSSGDPYVFETDLFSWSPFFTRDRDYDYIKGCQSIDGAMHVFVIAEKGRDSHWERSPIQSQYLDARHDDWRSRETRFAASGRQAPQVSRRQEGTVLPLLSNHYKYIGSGF